MKKIAITLIILVSVVFSFQILQEEEPVKIHNEQLSQTFLSKHIPIIDIRTKEEWKRTGIIKDSILLTFYDSDGRFNADSFFRNLKSAELDKESEFAILCRSGNRSNRVTRFLKSKGYKYVINLAGGIKQGLKNHIDFVQYN